MRSKKRLLKSWKIYAILDEGFFPVRRKLLRKFHELLDSPVDVIQLRFKHFGDRSLYRAAAEMVGAANRKGIPIIINDRPEIALALGASGVHLGKGDIHPAIAREMLGKEAIIGHTIRGPGDLASIDGKDVDYVAIGPFFRTPLKTELAQVPRSRIRKTSKASRLPLVAIGGINKNNVREVMNAGIGTVAFVRYGICEKDTRKKIKELRKILTAEIK